MIKLIATISSFTFLTALIPFLLINTFLTIKLWKNNYLLINKIVSKAPFKFRDRAKFMMESNLSSVAACTSFFTWYGYFILRYGWNIPPPEIKEWYREIKLILGVGYKYYRLNCYLMNILFFSFPVMILFIYLYKS